MIRKRTKKDISCISKRHLNRLIAQDSEIICDSLLNTATLRNCEYQGCLNNNFDNNSHIIDKHHEICIATENNTVSGNENNIRYENKSVMQLNKEDSEESSESISYELISNVGSKNANATTDKDLKDNLATWATKYQISHIALRHLLQRLKQHSCFSKLSIDTRTLLQTPRKQEIRTVTPGTYYHFGLMHSILQILTSIKDYIDCV